MNSLCIISSIAVSSICVKFPEAFLDDSKRQVVFDIIEMIAEELIAKNYSAIAQPFFDSFVDVCNI